MLRYRIRAPNPFTAEKGHWRDSPNEFHFNCTFLLSPGWLISGLFPNRTGVPSLSYRAPICSQPVATSDPMLGPNSCALRSLSAEKMMAAFSSWQMHSRTLTIQPMPWIVRSIWATYTSPRKAFQTRWSPSSRWPTLGTMVLSSQSVFKRFISFMQAWHWARSSSQPASKQPLYLAMSSGWACRAQPRSVKTTF